MVMREDYASVHEGECWRCRGCEAMMEVVGINVRGGSF